MGDYFPTLPDIVKDLIILGITSLLVFAYKKVRAFRLDRLPNWAIQFLLVYGVLSGAYFIYSVAYYFWPVEVHRREIFRNSTLTLDNTLYEQCTFIGCRLVVNGRKPIGLVGCNLIAGSHLYFDNRASLGFSLVTQIKEGSPGLRQSLDKMVLDYIKMDSLLPGHDTKDMRDL